MGSGRVLLGSGCVLELKNDTSKIFEIHCKKQRFGLRRLPFRGSGYGWVLAGSGGFWAGSGGFWVGFGA